MVSVCLPSDALLQHLPSYLGFSYLGRGVSLHSCSSKAQPLLLTLDEGYLLTAALPDLQHGIAPLGQLSSVTQSCPTLCDPKNCSMPGLPVHHQLPEFTQTHVHRVVMPSSHLILCRPLLLPPSIFPSIRVFSNESVLCIRWPKYLVF